MSGQMRLLGAVLLLSAFYSYGQEPAKTSNLELEVTEAQVEPAQPEQPALEIAPAQQAVTQDQNLVPESFDAQAPEGEISEQVEVIVVADQTNHHIFEIGDVSIHYRVFGEGSPLLLVHGFLDSSELWLPFVESLAKNHTVIVPDLRGHGSSTNPSGLFAYTDAASDLSALMAHLNIAKFDAVGYGEGALTLTRIAVEQPKRIGKLTLIGAGPYLVESARAKIRKVSDFSSFSQELKNELLSLHKYGELQVKSLVEQFAALAEDYQEPNFTPPLLNKIEADVLIVSALNDSYFPVEPALEQYQHLNQASLWIIPDLGHNLMFYDAPESVQAEFLRILENHLQN